MQATEIRREAAQIAECGALGATLSAEALEVLGYDGTHAAEAAKAEPKPRLKAALATLDIEILNRQDVERYKLEKLFEVLRAQLAARPERAPFAYWRDERSIADYRKPVPEFVLNKAIQIKRAVPECQIVIAELEEAPDPFLIAKLGYSEEYYVEVWDEPTFENR